MKEASYKKSFKTIDEAWNDLFGMLVEAHMDAGEEQ